MWRRRLLKKGGAKRNAKKGEHDFQSVLEKIAKARKKAVPCAKGLGKVINGKVTASGGKRWVKRHVIHNRGSKDVGSQSSTGKIGQPWFSKVSASG